MRGATHNPSGRGVQVPPPSTAASPPFCSFNILRPLNVLFGINGLKIPPIPPEELADAQPGEEA
jgi:hypothetical protein